MKNVRAACVLVAFAAAPVLLPAPAWAHGGGAEVGGPLGPWTFEPWVILPWLLVLFVYCRGIARLWGKAGRGRGIPAWRAASFIGGQACLALALMSPLDALGDDLFCAHMVQHGILIAVAPPLLLLGSPHVALAWGLPSGAMRALAASRAWRGLVAGVGAASRPVLAALVHGVVIWAWHVPALFEMALVSAWVHAIEHVLFLATALLLWRPLVSPKGGLAAAAAAGAAFATLMHSGLLGALLTFANAPLYPWYVGRTAEWGLTPLEDQQLAGLLMWIPLGLAYLAAGLAAVARLLAGDGQRQGPEIVAVARPAAAP